MAWETAILDIPMRASNNVTAITYTGNPPVYSSGGIAQYTLVVQDTTSALTGDIIGATAATAPAMGILQNRSIPQSGPGAIAPLESAQVRVLGISKLVAGAAVVAGALVMSNGSGQGILATTTNYANGMVLSPSTASGDNLTVFVFPIYQK